MARRFIIDQTFLEHRLHRLSGIASIAGELRVTTNGPAYAKATARQTRIDTNLRQRELQPRIARIAPIRSLTSDLRLRTGRRSRLSHWIWGGGWHRVDSLFLSFFLSTRSGCHERTKGFRAADFARSRTSARGNFLRPKDRLVLVGFSRREIFIICRISAVNRQDGLPNPSRARFVDHVQ